MTARPPIPSGKRCSPKRSWRRYETTRDKVSDRPCRQRRRRIAPTQSELRADARRLAIFNNGQSRFDGACEALLAIKLDARSTRGAKLGRAYRVYASGMRRAGLRKPSKSVPTTGRPTTNSAALLQRRPPR